MFESGTSDLFSFISLFTFQKLGLSNDSLIELFMGSIAWTKSIEKSSKTVLFSDYGVD